MSSSSIPTRSFFSTLLSEPLVHFLVLGGLVFALDRAVAARDPEPNVIVVGSEVEQEARNLFRSAQGREPTPAELKVLRERWVDNEVLYREGLALRLEQGDSTLRDRVIFKALNVIESNLRVPAADERTLRSWFEQHRAQYDTPARADFLEAVVVGDKSEAAAQRFALALNTGAQADIESGLRVFKDRPRGTIVDSFGAQFAQALDQLPLEQWHVLPSNEGPRVVRVQALQPGASARFDDVQTRVRQDWQDAKAQALRTAAVRELAKKYTVRLAETKS